MSHKYDRSVELVDQQLWVDIVPTEFESSLGTKYHIQVQYIDAARHARGVMMRLCDQVCRKNIGKNDLHVLRSKDHRSFKNSPST